MDHGWRFLPVPSTFDSCSTEFHIMEMNALRTLGLYYLLASQVLDNFIISNATHLTSAWTLSKISDSLGKPPHQIYESMIVNILKLLWYKT